MKLFGKDLDRGDTIVVAEVGVNHEGDVEVASGLIKAMAEAGADAVKLQSYTPWRYASQADPVRFERVTRFGLDEEAHRRLAADAESAGIALFSTPVTEDWVPLLAELFPAVKIASGDIDFEPVIRAAAATGLPVLLSTGASTLDEIDRAVGWFDAEIGSTPRAERLVLFHCVSAYPAPIEESNLLAIPVLAERYGVHVGWSNHVIGFEACIAAAALGAPIFEVHVTDRRDDREFRDHSLSFEADEVAELVRLLPAVRTSLGVRDKVVGPSESQLLPAIRKGVIAVHALPAGHVLARDDLAFARPASDVPAAEIDRLVGMTLPVDLESGQLVPRSMLDAVD